MAEIFIKRNFDLSVVADNLKNKIIDSTTDQIDEEIEAMVDRTQAGRDKFGHPFIGYAPSTRKFGIVNLTETGDMLGAITADIIASDTDAFWQVSFNDPRSEEIAGYHINGTDKMPVRDFFGFSQESLKRIKERIIEGVAEAFKSGRK